MKKLIFIFMFTPAVLFGGTITVTHSDGRSAVIDEDEIKIAEDSVMDAYEWIKAAWLGKVNNCRERIVKKEVSFSIKNEVQLPKKKDDIVDQHFNRSSYKNRKERDEEDKIKER